MSRAFRQGELEAYLDEALPASEMAEVEKAVRADRELAGRLAEINAQRSAGLHSLGGVWRRHRLSCPSRQQLGSYLLGVLPDEWTSYVKFHLEVVGCRFCQANVADLESQEAEAREATESRRRKYFQSSVGQLRRK